MSEKMMSTSLPGIPRRVSEHIELVFGVGVKGVGNSYVLLKKLDLT